MFRTEVCDGCGSVSTSTEVKKLWKMRGASLFCSFCSGRYGAKGSAAYYDLEPQRRKVRSANSVTKKKTEQKRLTQKEGA